MVVERILEDRQFIDDLRDERAELELIDDTGPLLSRKREGFEPLGLNDPEIGQAIFDYNERVTPDYKKHAEYKAQMHNKGSRVVKPLSEWEPLLITVMERNQIIDFSNVRLVDEAIARLERSNQIIDEVNTFKKREEYEAMMGGYKHYLKNGFTHEQLAEAAGNEAELVEVMRLSRIVESRAAMHEILDEDDGADLLVALKHIREQSGHFADNLVSEALLRAELMVLLEREKIS